MNSYAVYCQWDSYLGSQFVETHTEWVYASSKLEARSKANMLLSYHKGFKINDVVIE